MSNFLRELFGEDVDTFRSSDQNAIYAGKEWMARIFEELKTAKVLISMLSPASVSRPWINFEAGATWMGNTKVIPVCFGGLTISNLPKPYSSLQAVEVITPHRRVITSRLRSHITLARKHLSGLTFPGWDCYRVATPRKTRY
jgi:hypothetical protein